MIYINGLLCGHEIEKCLQLGVKFSENILSGLLLADDLVGVHVAETGSALYTKFDSYCT